MASILSRGDELNSQKHPYPGIMARPGGCEYAEDNL